MSDLASTSSGRLTQPFDASSAGLVGEIVVAHRDRLARIGYGLSTSFLGQDQFSLSSKIMLATDVQKNSTKTSWRCLPISQPNTTESVPMSIEKWLVAQDQDPTERGAERASQVRWDGEIPSQPSEGTG
jgi:hypothetical protein